MKKEKINYRNRVEAMLRTKRDVMTRENLSLSFVNKNNTKMHTYNVTCV